MSILTKKLLTTDIASISFLIRSSNASRSEVENGNALLADLDLDQPTDQHFDVNVCVFYLELQ